MDLNKNKEQLKELLEELNGCFMPFGKYGPKSLPPNGAPLIDLPLEYLIWFQHKGFPKGDLGRLMESVFQLKMNGNDFVFDKMRKKNGGRHVLRNKNKKSYNFGKLD